jgi:alcohol dehydrogenase
VVLTGDADADSAAIRAATGPAGGVDLAFDMVGQAKDAHATLAALKTLRRQGRLVLMGSMQVPLPIPYGELMRNNWELIGHFMYTPADYAALVALAASGQLPLDAVDVQSFGFTDLEAAIDAAGSMAGLQSTVVRFGG